MGRGNAGAGRSEATSGALDTSNKTKGIASWLPGSEWRPVADPLASDLLVSPDTHPTGITMDNSSAPPSRSPLILAPGAGRLYPMGRISALFKADGVETAGQYSISEWWLEAHTQGPGPHSHPEDDTFFVIEGTMSFLVGDEWIDAPRGSFILIPGGHIHDFENRSDQRAGLLNFSAPGTFEPAMPAIEAWFAEHPPGHAGP